MRPVVVVENTQRFPFVLPDAEVVTARSYLTDAQYSERRGLTVFNLCRTYGYQTVGYYVSLLAEARGHRPLPSVETLQDLRLSPVLRIVSEELDELIDRSLSGLRSERFELSVYFGRNLAKRYDRLSKAIFDQFPLPLLRASFLRDRDHWELAGLRAVATSEIPESHREFIVEQAGRFFGRRHRARRSQPSRFDLAILTDAEEVDRPSDDLALKRFVKAAEQLGIEASLVGRDDYGRLLEYDALFIRETTAVDHHTYRFSRRAAAAGLVVIDDPVSILRCTNKIYQAELFARHGIPCPPTLVVHDDNRAEVEAKVGLPCVLKVADGSFSRGVVKLESREALEEALDRMLDASQLVLAQGFLRSDFDWRIGVLDRKPLYACRYHMARGDWRIATTGPSGQRRYGRVEAVPLEEAPKGAVAVATRAAGLVGEGLYGVDVKPVGGRFLVIEINDNPNLEAGCEDAVLGSGLYTAIMRHFLVRLEARGAERSAP